LYLYWPIFPDLAFFVLKNVFGEGVGQPFLITSQSGKLG
jgi:hypothetical protein